MAQLHMSIKINGLDFIIRVIKDFVDKTDFKEGISDDYKNGFYDFSNAIINMPEKLKDDGFIRID